MQVSIVCESVKLLAPLEEGSGYRNAEKAYLPPLLGLPGLVRMPTDAPTTLLIVQESPGCPEVEGVLPDSKPGLFMTDSFSHCSERRLGAERVRLARARRVISAERILKTSDAKILCRVVYKIL